VCGNGGEVKGEEGEGQRQWAWYKHEGGGVGRVGGLCRNWGGDGGGGGGGIEAYGGECGREEWALWGREEDRERR